jgi:hypothetical protein
VRRLPAGSLLSGVALALVLVAMQAPIAAAATHGGNPPPRHLAPPGNPAVSEYLEDVPTDMGSAPPGSGSKPTHTLSSSQRQKLDKLGADGKLLVNVDNDTAPAAANTVAATPRPKSKSKGLSNARSHRPAQSHSSTTPAVVSASFIAKGRDDSSVSAVLGAATGQGGGGGTGVLLPTLMGVGLLLVVVSLVRRRGARRS